MSRNTTDWLSTTGLHIAAVLGAALGFGAQRLVQDLLSGFFAITERHRRGGVSAVP